MRRRLAITVLAAILGTTFGMLLGGAAGCRLQPSPINPMPNRYHSPEPNPTARWVNPSPTGHK